MKYISGHHARKGLSVTILVDEIDRDLEPMLWTIVRMPHTNYGQRNINVDGTWTHFQLHRVIGARIVGRELLPEEHIDHRNGNGLDNRRGNLRIVSRAQNNANRTKLEVRNKSGFRGVHWEKRREHWIASATLAGLFHYIGRFDKAEDAARAACAWRKENMPGYLCHCPAGLHSVAA